MHVCMYICTTRQVASLQAAEYGELWVDLAFWIDRADGAAPDAETLRVANGPEWAQGIKSVHVWPRSACVRACVVCVCYVCVWGGGDACVSVCLCVCGWLGGWVGGWVDVFVCLSWCVPVVRRGAWIGGRVAVIRTFPTVSRPIRHDYMPCTHAPVHIFTDMQCITIRVIRHAGLYGNWIESWRPEKKTIYITIYI